MSLVNKRYVDVTILTEDAKGAANGVAELDAQGRIPAAQLPTAATEYKGAFDADTGSPALANGTGVNGDLYRVSVEGTYDFGAGDVDLFVGDLVIYNGSVYEVAPDSSSFQGKTTDDLPEGATNFYYTETRFDASLAGKSTSDLAEGVNLYFTQQRVQDTIVSDFTSVASAPVVATDNVAGAISKLQSQITNSGPGVVPRQEVITLVAGDITNGYYDLANTPLAAIVTVVPDDGITQTPGTDFTVSTNRVTFAGDLATNLIAGDVVTFTYLS